MGQKKIGTFREVHIRNLGQATKEISADVDEVLRNAQTKIHAIVNKLIATKLDQDAFIKFLSAQALGKKARALIVERAIESNVVNMWDVVNVLTEEGHNGNNSQSLQHGLEKAAGELMVLAA